MRWQSVSEDTSSITSIGRSFQRPHVTEVATGPQGPGPLVAVACAARGGCRVTLPTCCRKGGVVGCCGTCLDPRGIDVDQLIEDAHRSTMEELADWTLEVDRIVSF